MKPTRALRVSADGSEAAAVERRAAPPSGGTGSLEAREPGVPIVSEGLDATILVVSFNTRSYLLACLASIFEETPELRYEVVVVDNASSDGSVEAVRERFPPDRFPSLRLIALGRNLGFGAANNLAAREAHGRHLVLLNPDTVVVDRAVERLVRRADANPDCGILGGRTLHADGTLNPASCWGAPTLWSVFCQATCLTTLFPKSRLFDPTSLGRWGRDTERDVDVVSGCFLLVPRPLWDRLGGFDERYFMYGEDVDLSLRARELGRPCRITPEATVMHVGAASEPIKEDKLVRLLRAQRQLFRAHWSRPAASAGLVLQSFGTGVRAVGARLARHAGVLRHRPAAGAWEGVWRRRAEWR